MQLSNNKILLTGGASGIGLGLTERLVREGNQVIICGRTKERLDEVAARYPTKVIPMAGDLSRRDDILKLYRWISESHPDLNVLINNAGVQHWMNVFDDDFYERATQEMEINVMSAVHLTSLFIKLKSLTTVMNVTSGLAFVPMAAAPVYCATKAFMRSFSLSLRHQLRAKNIEVIEVIPRH